MSKPLSEWSAEEISNGRLWVEAWSRAGVAIERLRRRELRELDTQRAVSLLSGAADYRTGPRAARPSSGLVEQQRWFRKVAHGE